MFEAAEVGHKLSKTVFENQVPNLRVHLVNAQYDLRSADFPVVIVIAGSDRPGCADLLHNLHVIMDGRYMQTNALGERTDEECERPRLWRYWRTLPRRGQIGVFLGGWALDLIRDRLNEDIDDVQLEHGIDHVRRFEEGLVADGALVLKFWLHLPKRTLKKRLKKAKDSPKRAWHLDKLDRRLYGRYEEAMPISERVVRETSSGDTRWQIIESSDPRYRNLRVAELILAALTQRLDAGIKRPARVRKLRAVAPRRSSRTILSTVDLSRSLTRPKYRKELERHQAMLSRLTDKARRKGVSSVLLFEGWDAAGKGGVIRRLTAAVNPEDYHLVPISAPTEEERAHHYLWRFWRQLPRAGRLTIFDRSWYGRVLVERVEGFASVAEWQRAYSEINDFEEQLYERGIVLLKFWLHIDPDEQLRRFHERLETDFKKYKITEEDFRNRRKWPEYERAVHEMVARTSTEYAPWHLLASNDKRAARVDVLEICCQGLKRML